MYDCVEKGRYRLGHHKLAVHLFVVVMCVLLPTELAFYMMLFFYVIGVFSQWKDSKKEQVSMGMHSRWWEVLGVNTEASIDECARVRKLLSKIYHPDSGQAPNLEHMQRINEAFEQRAGIPETPETRDYVTH